MNSTYDNPFDSMTGLPINDLNNLEASVLTPVKQE